MNDNEYLLNEYLIYLDKVLGYTQSTIKRNKSVCIKWFLFLEKRDISKATCAGTEDVLAWIEYRRTKEKVSDRTISGELCIFRTLYNFLISLCGSTNPVGTLPPFISIPPKEKIYLTVDEVFKLLETCNTDNPVGLRDYVIIALLWSTGLRTKEFLSLQWKDIDLEYGTLIVRKGKGRKQRQLFLNDRIKNDLQNYRSHLLVKNNTSLFLKYENRKLRKNESSAIGRKQLSKIVKNAVENSNINKNVTPLTLRHTFATHMYEAGVNIKDIQEMMGHNHKTETTVYIHVTMNAAIKLLNSHVYHTHIHKVHREYEKNNIG